MPPAHLLTFVSIPAPSYSTMLLPSTLQVPSSQILAVSAPPLWAIFFFSLFAGESLLNLWLHFIDEKIWQPLAKIRSWPQWAGTRRGCWLLPFNGPCALQAQNSVLSFGDSLALWGDFSLWLLVKWLRATWFYTLDGCSTCGCDSGWAYWDSVVYSIRANSKFFLTWPG